MDFQTFIFSKPNTITKPCSIQSSDLRPNTIIKAYNICSLTLLLSTDDFRVQSQLLFQTSSIHC